jgi:hypothetical protein
MLSIFLKPDGSRERNQSLSCGQYLPKLREVGTSSGGKEPSNFLERGICTL